MRGSLLFLVVVIGISASLLAQTPAWPPASGHTTLPVWPHRAPGAQPSPGPELDTTTAKDHVVAGKPVIRLGNVSAPTLTLYAPQDKNTGAAVVVFPGGGYRIVAIDLEGTEVCDWLDSGPYPKSSAALQDAQRALGIVRSTPPSGTSTRTVSVSSASPPGPTWLLPLALTSINVFTTRSMPPTSSAAARTL